MNNRTVFRSLLTVGSQSNKLTMICTTYLWLVMFLLVLTALNAVGLYWTNYRSIIITPIRKLQCIKRVLTAFILEYLILSFVKFKG